MRLVPLVACLMIASAAGCGYPGGDRDAGATGETATPAADKTSSRRATSAEAVHEADAAERAAEAAAIVAAAAARGTAREECATRPVDPAEAAERTASARARNALLLSVDVRDARTGTPVAGVAVGGGRTDARGHHEERRPMPYPGERIEVRCPTRIDDMQGRLLGTSPITVEHGLAHAAFDVEARCLEPTPHRIRRRFAGLYASGFETSNFLPCEGMPAEAAYYTWPHSYWVEMPRTVWNALDRAVPPQREPASRVPRFPIGLRKAYVEWSAIETGPGLNGHMGNGLYQLDVETLYRVSADPPASCRPPGWEQFGHPPQRADPRERPFPFKR